jgi:hypothetical protein
LLDQSSTQFDSDLDALFFRSALDGPFDNPRYVQSDAIRDLSTPDLIDVWRPLCLLASELFVD